VIISEFRKAAAAIDCCGSVLSVAISLCPVLPLALHLLGEFKPSRIACQLTATNTQSFA